MLSPRNIGQGLKSQYDKLIAVVVLFGLVASLVYLAIETGHIRQRQSDFDRELDRMRPSFPTASPEDVKVYEEAADRIAHPFLVPAWTNAMFVPEIRVWCVDCRRPISFQAPICAFCKAVQPLDPEDEPGYDGDRDRLPDKWEQAHGLNPLDPKDAVLDIDGDDFSAIEEYHAKPQTDPRDRASSPPIEAKLRLVKITADPFMLRFRSTIKMPDDSLKFQVNLRGGERTFFVKIGEDVEGFTVEKYDLRTVERQGVKLDASILTLKRGDREIMLERGKDVQYNEYTAELFFAPDDRRFTLKKGGEFQIRDRQYRLIEIDSTQQSVLVTRLHDGEKLDIRMIPQGDQ